MLHEFIALNRDAIIARTRQRVNGRPWPAVSARELEHGVPLFLTQLCDTLRQTTAAPITNDAIGPAAARHGEELLRLGFTISQVVHDYGDICQAITEIALECAAPITVEEFHTLNRCLDTAIAEAVTEHTRLTGRARVIEEAERLGHAAHELRDILNTGMLAFHMLRRGTVSINGSIGEVLGRSLMSLRQVVDSALADVRLTVGTRRRQRVRVSDFLDEIAASGVLHAEYRHMGFSVEPPAAGLVVEGDPQLLTSAVMNLVHNALKNTHAGGHVRLRAHDRQGRLKIEVEDQCGGIPESKGNLFEPFGDRDGSDRSGLGLGLSIARKAMRAHGGDIVIRNMPGQGCVFQIDLPLAVAEESPQ